MSLGLAPHLNNCRQRMLVEQGEPPAQKVMAQIMVFILRQTK